MGFPKPLLTGTWQAGYEPGYQLLTKLADHPSNVNPGLKKTKPG